MARHLLLDGRWAKSGVIEPGQEWTLHSGSEVQLEAAKVNINYYGGGGQYRESIRHELQRAIEFPHIPAYLQYNEYSDRVRLLKSNNEKIESPLRNKTPDIFMALMDGSVFPGASKITQKSGYIALIFELPDLKLTVSEN